MPKKQHNQLQEQQQHTKTVPLGFTIFNQDFLIDTLEWSADCIGVYTTLLMLQWSNGHITVIDDMPQAINNIEYIKEDDSQETKDAKKRRNKEREEKLKNIWLFIQHKFIAVEKKSNCWMNKKLNEQRIRKMRISEKRSEIGTEGANKRWGNNSGKRQKKEPQKTETEIPAQPQQPTEQEKRLKWFINEVEKNKHLFANDEVMQAYFKYNLNPQPDGRYYFETINNLDVEKTIKSFKLQTQKPQTNESRTQRTAKPRTSNSKDSSKTISAKPPGSFGKPNRNTS